ncbi:MULTISPECIES: Holliday junction branch migration protein RuvA [Snodgrassella]|uniref:Holliday junction branch migration complex subunit RuvA n=1 Tax=Snodgrassella alvi TaxID=1196083 RepID=A0A2N9Y6D7_9NEIS|nr:MULTISPECIES: Holliday junction branch migration protein RuvA [Snodgrassella]KES13656.1 Holliday junction resolvasome, DNA-binding subunit [Snodgrassella alvi SCGC AB-598-P14]AHN29650.1 Holliday junction DNA helicase RuvA [Snodgrassella alvi wkB2]MBI0068353.1 Holliday junction branch migration protein RuvA [Snodgrassella sp. M0110]MBI0077775.1 Holliday junction branch migration protein RuvA [Snodgrassella sp. M0118]MBI0079692.1 Holliday junction branch migration protein RuvA [Snodgrassella 
MISRLRGIILEKNPPVVVLDVHGVGYEAQVSMQTFYTLPAAGEETALYTQLVVREDAHLLFGFGSREERETFRALVKVSGIGAKSALGILSALTSEELAAAIATEDIKRLTAAPGIGKKTAERMVLELRGKLAAASDDATGLFTQNTAGNNEDIINTLLALGYTDKEARTACKNIPAGTDVSEGVRLALKNML